MYIWLFKLQSYRDLYPELQTILFICLLDMPAWMFQKHHKLKIQNWIYSLSSYCTHVSGKHHNPPHLMPPYLFCHINNHWSCHFYLLCRLPDLLLHFFLQRFSVYLRERDRESTTWGGGGQAEGEADFPLSRDPDVGLNPRTPGSWPEPKSDA